MDISNIAIVLCRPNESKNIGSVCRAMETMGLCRLRIVGNRADYDNQAVRMLAVHSYDVWKRAEFYSDLKSAVGDCVFAVGTTRRRGQKRKSYTLLPEEFAQKVFSFPSPETLVAVVFGNERTGLTDKELNVCNAALTIPSNPLSPSLNLSHAVQVITYELYRHAVPVKHLYSPVNLNRLERMMSDVADNLQSIGFFTLGGRSNMERFWLSVFARSLLSETEAVYIEKIFAKAAALALKGQT